MSRRAVRAVVIRDGKLLVMHRNKFGTEYETLPGGGIEPGEDPEQTVHRELAEETSITVSNLKLVFVEEAGDPYGAQYVYLCEYAGGEPRLSDDSEEAKIHKLGQNLYEPLWVSLEELPVLSFVSEKLKQAVIDGVANGFPEKVIKIS